jgi:uncharacterized protein with PIN domain
MKDLRDRVAVITGAASGIGRSLAEESSQSQTREAMRCPACGGQMHYKGQRGRDVVTEAGEVHVERDYYYCPACRRGLFPPGPTLAVE